MSSKRRGYSRDDVELHNDNGSMYGPVYPAVNVKVYSYPTTWKIADALGITEKAAQKALDECFDSSQEAFWQFFQPYDDIFERIFGYKGDIYSAGRSAGWLIVTNMDDVDSWDAITLAKWRKFERLIEAEVDYLSSWDYVLKDIKDNLEYWKEYDKPDEEDEE